MDDEFECLKPDMLKRRHGMPLNICAKNEHVPEIERKIRTVKERIRGVGTTLPFKKLPSMMVFHLVMFSIPWLIFPAQQWSVLYPVP